MERASATFSMLELGDRLETSRTLTYAYFDDRDAVIEAILRRHIALLEKEGLASDGAFEDLPTKERMVQYALILMRHVQRFGPLLHYILREVPQVIKLPRDVAGFFAGTSLRSARDLKKDLRLSPIEALTVVEMMPAIPEELGRLLQRGALEPADAEAVCRRLVENAYDALVPIKASAN